jgi:hypothetical protein
LGRFGTIRTRGHHGVNKSTKLFSSFFKIIA